MLSPRSADRPTPSESAPFGYFFPSRGVLCFRAVWVRIPSGTTSMLRPGGMEEFVTEDEEPWYDQRDLEQGR